MVDHLLDYDNGEEVIAAFVWRDQVHDDLTAGRVLDDNARQLLESADHRVLEMRAKLVRRFPEVFMDRAPREYWWWHLHEGPQVREEAMAAQRT